MNYDVDYTNTLILSKNKMYAFTDVSRIPLKGTKFLVILSWVQKRFTCFTPTLLILRWIQKPNIELLSYLKFTDSFLYIWEGITTF